MGTDEADMISDFLQAELRARGVQEVAAVDAAEWLDAAGLLRDSPSKPGKPLRDLLRAGKVLGQHQDAEGFWSVRRVSGFEGQQRRGEPARGKPTEPANRRPADRPPAQGKWPGPSSDDPELIAILREAKRLAQKYRLITGKPLGITGEVAEYEAARLLGLELTAARQAGYDAIERVNGRVRRLRVKGRCMLGDSKRTRRLGSIKLDKEWDSVLLVLLDANFDAVEIWEADRAPIAAALTAPGSKARNERGALAVSKFKSLGHRRWKCTAV